ncbi:MAG TPA: phosphatase PAP2 family protein [Acidimicrobiales bacterium]|nr:phosphatase PAP2 family protein [Acidimicrobiales bacterium]
MARYGMRVTLLGLAFVLVTVPFAILLFEVVAEGPLTHLDSSIANWMNSWVHGHPLLVTTLERVGWFGWPLWLGIMVTAGSVYAFWRGRRRLAIYLVVTVVGGSLVDTAVKVLVNRPRPVVDHPLDTAFGTSFPSGHSMASTLTYGALVLAFLPVLSRRARRWAVAGAVVMVLAIGCSRLLLGMHFLTDVLGGYVLGFAWLIGATAVFEIWREEEGRPHATPTDVVTEGVEPEAAPALLGQER